MEAGNQEEKDHDKPIRQCLLTGQGWSISAYFAIPSTSVQSWKLEVGLKTLKKDPVNPKGISSTQPSVFKAKYSVLCAGGISVNVGNMFILCM